MEFSCLPQGSGEEPSSIFILMGRSFSCIEIGDLRKCYMRPNPTLLGSLPPDHLGILHQQYSPECLNDVRFSPKHESTKYDCNRWMSVKSRVKSGRVRWPMEFIRAPPFCLARRKRWAVSHFTFHSNLGYRPAVSAVRSILFSHSSDEEVWVIPSDYLIWISLWRRPVAFFATYCIQR